MKKLVLYIFVVFFANVSFACDIDGDGIDDPTTIDNNLTWRSLLSSNNETVVRSNFANGTPIAPIPGRYWTDSIDTYGHVSFTSNYFWFLVNPDPAPGVGDASSELDSLFFGATNVSYYGGRDINGDGIDDAIKLESRCNQLRRSCFRRSISVNIQPNTPSERMEFDPDEGRRSGASLIVVPIARAGLSALFFMDADGDGSDDVCVARNLRRRKKSFRVLCNKVGSESVRVDRRRIGRLFSKIFSLENATGADSLFFIRKRKRRGDTLVFTVSPRSVRKRHIVPAVGDVGSGDWLGLGYEQVGILNSGVLTILDPITGSISEKVAPSTGGLVDCNNDFRGFEKRLVTSRNICRIIDCS